MEHNPPMVSENGTTDVLLPSPTLSADALMDMFPRWPIKKTASLARVEQEHSV